MKSINALSEKDTYSLILFILFKLKDLPEYSSISELIYILDKKNFLSLCEYFGGQTIRIPTFDELKETLAVLRLYELVEVEGKLLQDAYPICGYKTYADAQYNLNKVRKIIKNYNINW